MKVVIQIVTWNSLKFLPDCLTSINNQTYKDFSVLVIDNGSSDGTIEFIKAKYPEVAILRNNKNLGFAVAHNQGMKLFESSPYILVINTDIILEKDWLEKILSVVEKDKKIGAICGKLLKVYTSEPEINEKVKTKMIDSTGLKVLRSRRVVDRGEGELDNGQYNKEEEVFGSSGACVLYRREALEDVKILKMESARLRFRSAQTSAGAQFSNQIKDLEKIGEYFDEDFFSYKEDVDLSYRLRWRSWKIFYTSKAIAYHYRQVSGGKKKILEIIKRRKERSPLINYLSHRNHLFCLIKNDFLVNFFKDLPFILFYELKKFLYLLLFEQRTLKIILDIFKNLPKMFRKRREILKNKKINPKEMRKWFL